MHKLLIMPPTATNLINKPRFHFPFAIWYLGTYYKSLGHDVTLHDMNITTKVPDYSTFEWIGISCMSAQVPFVRSICKAIRKVSKAKIVIGGVHPTLFTEQTEQSKLVDEVVSGHVIKNFRDMPPLDYGLLDKDMMARKDKDYVGLITSIGCPYKCTFCVNSIVDEYNKWEAWDAERICEEIRTAQSFGFKNVFFWDDNFFTNCTRTERFIRQVKKERLRFKWFAFTRSNQVKKSLFSRCYDIGLGRVSLGGESGSNAVLRRLRKGIKVRDTENSARTLNSIGIEASYSYMIGLPGETKQDILDTVSHMKRMAKIQDLPKVVGPMLYCPYPGSKLYKECTDAGWSAPAKFEDWTNDTTGNADTPYNLPWIPADLKDMVQVHWFYSFLIPVPYAKILRLLRTYWLRTRKPPLLLPLCYILAASAAMLGKLRYKLQWYKWPVETFVFKKLKVVLGA